MYTSHHSASESPSPDDDDARRPTDLSFPDQPSFPHYDQAIHDSDAWNPSTHPRFPPWSPQGPGQATSSSHSIYNPPAASNERKRTTSPDHDIGGGYEPTPSGSHEGQTRPTSDRSPSPTIDFTERRDSAYDIWAFTRAVDTNQIVPSNQWLHLNKRPQTQFIGCKFCTEFG